MCRASILLATTALAATLSAGDFAPVVKATEQAFPGRTRYGVVCDYSYCQKQVADLRQALPAGATLTVFDVHHPMHLIPAAEAVLRRGVQLLAILPNDPLVQDGSAHATDLVGRMNGSVPAFGTTPAALKNGCSLALGPATRGELLVNPNLENGHQQGSIGPVEIIRMNL